MESHNPEMMFVVGIFLTLPLLALAILLYNVIGWFGLILESIVISMLLVLYGQKDE